MNNCQSGRNTSGSNGTLKTNITKTSTAKDQEARLFYFITMLAVSGLEKGPGQQIQTIRDLLEAFGN